MGSDITVVVTALPNRPTMLARALASITTQLHQPDAIVVAIDNDRLGAAGNRDRGLSMVDTEWVAFLDDDDEFYPNHLRDLARHQETHAADFVYPWFDVKGGTDPFPMHEGRDWDPADPHQVPITTLCRADMARAVGGFSMGFDLDADDVDADGNRAGEDFRFTLKLSAAGARIVHLNQRTWLWHHHGRNTSGLPSRAFA
jgi:glycosyltransferase involved in cell wall biosynthesis